MRHHETLEFTPAHINYILVETWEAFKLSSKTITQKYFNKTHLLLLSSQNIDTKNQSCLASTQQSNREKEDDIGSIAKASIEPIEMEGVNTTDPMVILRYKGRCRASNNLVIKAAVYDTASARNVLPLYQINTVKK